MRDSGKICEMMWKGAWVMCNCDSCKTYDLRHSKGKMDGIKGGTSDDTTVLDAENGQQTVCAVLVAESGGRGSR